MLEAVHGFGTLLKSGWRPKRTILVCSWDAEEEGLIGSTEWVEDHAKALEHAVAYFNVDVAVAGTVFGAEAVPSLSNSSAKSLPKFQPQRRQRLLQWKLEGIGKSDPGNTGHADRVNAPSET